MSHCSNVANVLGVEAWTSCPLSFAWQLGRLLRCHATEFQYGSLSGYMLPTVTYIVRFGFIWCSVGWCPWLERPMQRPNQWWVCAAINSIAGNSRSTTLIHLCCPDVLGNSLMPLRPGSPYWLTVEWHKYFSRVRAGVMSVP